ncbi:MAG: SpoIIE family protein phosphatase [Gammaproteobacteria bacterium]|jgi:serine phosphatase RsbU (regulator of sigma subunit)|nr:SpoIIE family protein phosphatase [Gammaproteobacteria bacterium]
MESDVSQLLLITDESLVSRQMLAHYECLHYQVLATKEPLQALQLLADNPVHLILFFYHPKLASQTALLQDMLDKFEEIPLLLVTEVTTALDVTRLLSLGVTSVFSLPLESQSVLDRCVARHVRHAKLFFDNRRYRQQLEQTNQKLNDSLAELERDQQAGRLMQQRLMPPVETRRNGLTIQRHMQSSLYLSGDFVDHMSLSDGSVLFYLADVSGHGASSAILTILLKSLTRGILADKQFEHGQSVFLEEIMSRLNEEILDFDVDKHLTMFMGLISPDGLTLNYCVGGHYPMPVLYQEQQLTYLTGLGSSFPLGLFEGAEYKSLQQSLAPNFSLLLCSDGILEVLPNQQDRDQEAMLLDILQANGCHIAGLVSGLQLDQRQQLPDDIAVLSIEGAGHG